MSLEENPILAATLQEFIDPRLRGEFLAWPTDNDHQRMQAVMEQDHNILANVPLFNSNPDITGQPQLTTQPCLFSPEAEAEDEFKMLFLSAYGQHIDVVQNAYNELEATKFSEEDIAMLTEGRDGMLQRLAITLAGEGRRLLGGFALIATKAKPKEYVSYVFGARTLLEMHQFTAREMILRGGMADHPSELRKNVLVMQPDQRLTRLTHNVIARKLIPKAQIARNLGIEIEEISSGE